MDVLYTAVATANGREGRAVSSDGLLDVTLAPPKSLGGNGQGTNPEQLFAAGYAACFASALSVVGRAAKVDTSEASVTAEVSIGGNGRGGTDGCPSRSGLFRSRAAEYAGQMPRSKACANGGETFAPD